MQKCYFLITFSLTSLYVSGHFVSQPKCTEVERGPLPPPPNELCFRSLRSSSSSSSSLHSSFRWFLPPPPPPSSMVPLCGPPPPSTSTYWRRIHAPSYLVEVKKSGLSFSLWDEHWLQHNEALLPNRTGGGGGEETHMHHMVDGWRGAAGGGGRHSICSEGNGLNCARSLNCCSFIAIQPGFWCAQLFCRSFPSPQPGT